MKKLKIYNSNNFTNNLKLKMGALLLTGATFASSFVGCTNTKGDKQQSISTPISTAVSVENDADIKSIVNDTNKEIKEIIPELNDELSYDTSIVLLLDEIAKKDENGKINASEMKNLKDSVDTNNIMNNFNATLDIAQQKMIKSGEILNLSGVVYSEKDQLILSEIEKILNSIIKYKNENNEEKLLEEWNKIYDLFALGKKIDGNGLEIKVSDLSYSSRAIANAEVESGIVIARDYIPEDQLKVMDKILNDQNNKAYITSTLEIISNDMPVKESEIDIKKVLNDKYEDIIKRLDNKIKIDEAVKENIKDLVNYMNIEYLTSSKVSYKDKNVVISEVTEEDLTRVVDLISAINKYNLQNPEDAVAFSGFLIDEFAKTEKGEADSKTLNIIQASTYALDANKKVVHDVNSFRNLPSGKYIFDYITKSDIEYNADTIIWQNTTDGSRLVNYVIIFDALNSLPEFDLKENYIEKANMDINETIKSIEKRINNECIKGFQLVK